SSRIATLVSWRFEETTNSFDMNSSVGYGRKPRREKKLWTPCVCFCSDLQKALLQYNPIIESHAGLLRWSSIRSSRSLLNTVFSRGTTPSHPSRALFLAPGVPSSSFGSQQKI